MENNELSDSQKAGLKMMDNVYGKAFSERIKILDTPIMKDTIEHLFAEIWSRPLLSVRDRRLLVMGATAATGSRETLTIQALGALKNSELSPDELREAALQLAYYAGWENGMEASLAFEEAMKRYQDEI